MDMPKDSLYSVKLRDDEYLSFSVKDYKGEKYLDIRLYFMTCSLEGTDHEMVLPTKRGITVKASFIDELMNGLTMMKKHLDGIKLTKD